MKSVQLLPKHKHIPIINRKKTIAYYILNKAKNQYIKFIDQQQNEGKVPAIRIIIVAVDGAITT